MYKNYIKKNTVSFGKVDYNNSGRKNHEVTVSYELYKKGDGHIAFSMHGDVWNTRHTDIVMGGQCIDTLVKLVRNNSLLKRMHKVWSIYHLNDMHAECEHQRNNWTLHKQVQVPHRYKENVFETKDISWVCPEEHPEGILGKPCEICGYKYGHGWNTMPIPNDVIDEIMSWSE